MLLVFSAFYKCYVCLVFAFTLIVTYPFFFVVLSVPKWRKYSFYLNIGWCYFFRILAFVFLKFTKKAPLPEGPYIICANHASYFDIFIMYSVMPKHRFLFLGKSEILNWPLMKTYFKKLNIPVYRTDKVKAAKSFIKAKSEVQNGWSLVIFPEGGIPDMVPPNMGEFKDGAFQLAKHCAIPIIPITFQNNYRIFSEPTNLRGTAYPGVAKVQIHEYISAEEVARLTVKELSAKVFRTIESGIL